MEKPETSFCCTERGAIYNLVHDLGLNCITQHPGYEGNCLNEYVVETSFYEFLEDYGHVGDDEPVHKYVLVIEPRCEKTCLWGFRPGKTQTGLRSHRSYLEACDFGYKN